MKPSDALQLLGLEPGAMPSAIKARWRQLATQHHPDKPGGNAETFQQYREAYQLALLQSLKPVRCTVCDGAGKVTEGSGFNTIRVRCKTCKGTGKLKP